MSTTTLDADYVRGELRRYLLKELGKYRAKEFVELIKEFGLGDLRNDAQMVHLAETGTINTLVVMYQMGILSKLKQIKKGIENV